MSAPTCPSIDTLTPLTTSSILTTNCLDSAFYELSSIVNIIWLLLCAFLVFFMQVGFALLEVGSVQAKNAKSILIKNLMDGAVGTIAWWGLGWTLAYGPGGSSFIGGGGAAMITTGSFVDGIHYGEWLFQWAFATTSATIVSGSMAERCDATAYLLFSFLMTSVIYPIPVHWVWSSDGWLADMGFYDFAGCGPVHMIGGICGLVGAVKLGPRTGRFNKDGAPNPMPAHNLVLSTTGCMFLWFGWYGFNGGSVLRITGGGHLRAARACVCTTIAASVGGITTYMAESYMTGVKDLPPLLNGVLAGLVSVTASADVIDTYSAFLVGVVGSVVYSGVSRMVLNNRVDDPLDAFALHCGCGIWGLIAVGLFADGGADGSGVKGMIYGDSYQIGLQLLGIVVIGIWAAACSYCSFEVIGYVMNRFLSSSIRVSMQVEKVGMDEAKHGGSAYPDFVKKLGPPVQDMSIVSTDIEGNTDLWAFDSALMNHCQGLHDAILRECLTTHSGYEISTDGDTFQMAFHTSVDAINFCMDVQVELLQTVWPAELLALPKAAIALQKDMQVSKDIDKANSKGSETKRKKKKGKGSSSSTRRSSGGSSDSSKRKKNGSDDGLRRIFSGLRVRMALDHGYCDHSVHEMTGRYSYTGQPITNVKAILSSIQSGGQIVASSRVMETLKVKNSMAAIRESVVVDLGTHVIATTPLPLSLTQFLPAGLKDRELLPLKTVRKISPAYLDAPDAMVPEGVPLPPVTMAFLYVTDRKALKKLRPAVASRVKDCYTACVREFLVVHEGYECSEDSGTYMVAFKSPVKACYWAIAVHLAFLKMDWSNESKQAQEALEGYTVGIGIHSGIPEAISPHPETGKADYFGSFVTQAAMIGDEAEAGEVLLSSSAFQNLPAEHNLKIDVGDKLSLKGVQDKVQLYDLMVPEERSVEPKNHEYAKWKPFTVNDPEKSEKKKGMFGQQLKITADDAGASGSAGRGGKPPAKRLVGEDAVVASVFEDAEQQLGAWRIDPDDLDTNGGFYIASGAFGDVRTGTFRGTMVAIKTLKRERVDLDSMERFKQELILCRDLRHPNIMQVLGGCWDSADKLMLVSEFCEKGSLGKLLRREGSGHKLMSSKLRWISEIAKAMCYLHGFRPPILHRDLKADNMLVNQSLQVKLCDFGESRQAKQEGTMTTVGSPFWMAPEVFMGKNYGVSCDVYSFAIVMLEIAYNGDLNVIFAESKDDEYVAEDKTPFSMTPGSTVLRRAEEEKKAPTKKIGLAVAHQVTNGWRPRLSRTLSKKSPSFIDLIKKCWDQDTEKRPKFPNILEMVTKLMRNADLVNDCELEDGKEGDSGSSTGGSNIKIGEFDGSSGSSSAVASFTSPGESLRGMERIGTPGGLMSVSENEVAEFRAEVSTLEQNQIKGEIRRGSLEMERRASEKLLNADDDGGSSVSGTHASSGHASYDPLDPANQISRGGSETSSEVNGTGTGSQFNSYVKSSGRESSESGEGTGYD